MQEINIYKVVLFFCAFGGTLVLLTWGVIKGIHEDLIDTKNRN